MRLSPDAVDIDLWQLVGQQTWDFADVTPLPPTSLLPAGVERRPCHHCLNPCPLAHPRASKSSFACSMPFATSAIPGDTRQSRRQGVRRFAQASCDPSVKGRRSSDGQARHRSTPALQAGWSRAWGDRSQPTHERNIELITRFMRRDPDQQKIASIDCQHHAGTPLPALHVREGKLYGHHFPNPKYCHTPRRPESRP